MNKINLIDAEPLPFKTGPDGELLIKKQQHITDWQLEQARDMRHYEGREGEFMSVAEVPTIVVEMWKRQGFDMMDRNVTARDIVKRLRAEGLEAFITTRKKVSNR